MSEGAAPQTVRDKKGNAGLKKTEAAVPPGKTGGAAAFSAVWEWNDKSRLNLSYDLSILKTEGSLML